MKNSRIGLAAILAAVCSSAGAATLSVSTSGNAATQFTYSATVLRNDTVSVHQFQFAFNTPDTAASISNVITPFGWKSAIESANDSGWSYSAKDDLNSGHYGLSAYSFEEPAAVLSFSYDASGQASADQDLLAANQFLLARTADLNNARDVEAAREAALPVAQAAVDAARQESLAAQAEVQATASRVAVRNARIGVLLRDDLEALQASQRNYDNNANVFTLLALEGAKTIYNTAVAKYAIDPELLTLEAAHTAAQKTATQMASALTVKVGEYAVAVDALAAAVIAERDAIEKLADLRMLAAGAEAQLALYPDALGRVLSGFSYVSLFGPISGPALLTGIPAGQSVGILVAGEPTMAPVPLPASTLLLLTGLASIAGLKRRKNRVA